MAEIIADESIAAVVDPSVWDRAMGLLTTGLKKGAPAFGFGMAIGSCADILAERFPARAGDNPNELPDAVVILPRLEDQGPESGSESGIIRAAKGPHAMRLGLVWWSVGLAVGDTGVRR